MSLLQANSGLSIGQTPLELFKFKNEQDTQIALQDRGIIMPGSNIEANLWLPAAAKPYCISGDIRDYVLVPVPIMFSDIPNTNGDSVSMAELLRFHPDLGMQAFKTFRGKPTHYEHDNKDITKAKGVILDAFMQRLRGFGQDRYWKLILLLAFDRTKDPMLVNSILTGENNAYSLGFYFKSYKCAVCKQRFGEGGNPVPCEHTAPRRPTFMLPGGKLSYRECENIRGFETSVVGSPAYVPAISKRIMDVRSF